MSVCLDDRATDIIQTANGKYVYIDTCWPWDRNCYETMVFKCDKNGKVTSWKDLDAAWYDNPKDADIGHAEMINKWMKEVLV